MRAAKNLISGGGTAAELLRFLWARRLWWLIPFVVALLVAGTLVIVGQVTGIASFIYTLF